MWELDDLAVTEEGDTGRRNDTPITNEAQQANLAKLPFCTVHPEDHGNTPPWVIDVILPAIRAVGKPVADPFYHDGTMQTHLAQ